MPLADFDIANMALSHVGDRNKITSLSEASTEAEECNRWYDQCRKDCLALYNWSFARKRASLVAHADVPPSGIWGYRYQYPSDCIIARHIVNPIGDDAPAVPFEIELSNDGTQKTVLTNQDSAILVYTGDITAVTQFNTEFINLLSHWIAYNIAFSLTGDPRIEQKELQAFMTFWRMLTGIDANEGQAEPPKDASWITARTA